MARRSTDQLFLQIRLLLVAELMGFLEGLELLQCLLVEILVSARHI